jgi:predicted GNAT superfamily acetyltransferase
MPHDLTLRPLHSLEEYQACADFQEEIWGQGFAEKVPPAILMIANRLGGLAAGAFDESGELHGFVFGLTGVVKGQFIHWSDMLAVRGDRRDRGLGARLKRYQREVMLGRGIVEMRWTFDPLQGRNARLNFTKLGVISREYVEDMYGDTDSPLHQGIGTDRLVAYWFLDSRRVAERLERGWGEEVLEGMSEIPRVLVVRKGKAGPCPEKAILGLNDSRVLLPIPTSIESLMDVDPSLASAWRESTRELFLHYLARGYGVREFVRGPTVSSYLLVRAGVEGGRDAEGTAP